MSDLVYQLLSAQDKQLSPECKSSSANTLLSSTNIFFRSETLLMKKAVQIYNLTRVSYFIVD